MKVPFFFPNLWSCIARALSMEYAMNHHPNSPNLMFPLIIIIITTAVVVVVVYVIRHIGNV